MSLQVSPVGQRRHLLWLKRSASESVWHQIAARNSQSHKREPWWAKDKHSATQNFAVETKEEKTKQNPEIKLNLLCDSMSHTVPPLWTPQDTYLAVLWLKCTDFLWTLFFYNLLFWMQLQISWASHTCTAFWKTLLLLSSTPHPKQP